MKVINTLFLGALLSSVASQGFPPYRQVPIQRRQLSQVQQNHILTDIQQHQHRFNVHPGNQQPQFRNQFNNGRQQQTFVQQQSQSFAFPPQTSTIQNSRFQLQPPSQQPPPVFRQNIRQPPIAPPAPPQNTRQTQFQRSVQNQIGQVSFNQPQPQFNQFQPQIVNNPFSVQDPFFNRPVASPLIQQQQLPVRQQQNFLPNGHVQFPQQSTFIQPLNNFQPEPNRLIQSPQFQQNFQPQVQNPFLQLSQALPLEQRANLFLDSRTEEQRQKEQQYRQKLIEKQEKYAQKFQQKQQQQVQQLHQEFLKKQQLIQEQTQQKLRPLQSQLVHENYQHNRGAHQSSELSGFDQSVRNYYHQSSGQLPTTASTTTPAPVTTTNPLLTVVPLKKTKKTEIKTFNPEDISQLLQGNQNLLSQLKLEPSKKAKSVKPAPLGRDEILKQLQKLALSDANQDLGDKNYTTEDITLPNGERVQVIRTSDPELIRKAKAGNAEIIEHNVSTTTPPPLSIEDLAKSGIVPPGADFEVIKQSESGLQSVKKVPQQKKVTFVYLEELDDGSYKVQGVKSNNDKEAKRSGAEVDSILKRIKDGEIQLPPAAKGEEKSIDIPTPAPSTTVSQRTTFKTNPSSVSVIPASSVSVIPASSSSSSTSTSLPKNHRASNTANSLFRSSTVAPQTDTSSRQTVTSSRQTVTSSRQTVTPSRQTATSSRQTVTPSRQTTRGSSIFQYSFSATTPEPEEDNGRSPYSTLPTFATSNQNNFFSVSPRVQRLSSTSEIPEYVTASSINYVQSADAHKYNSRGSTASATTSAPAFASSLFSSPSYSPTFTTTPPSTFSTASSTAAPELANILRDSGLFAMAKYLRQSGLDAILNETGPYTIFAPTDKAFKSLLVQLGGPEKAEEKFKNNPRLLSGLLLHHVIPGSFKIEDLQDEMTGVSLAGTQLRVNQYAMQDTEWNDIKVTTINGASIASDNNDIVIPQGIAHSVDRVMFPLPVGDLLQTLQSDRERRFTHFLRAIFASNMADTLQNKGIKTYTVFAPTDLAFSHLSQDELNTLVSDKDSAQQLVQRHILPATLYTSGMRFYQVKDTLAEDKALTVQKNGGKVKVNESTILTSNIPSTNGVIHAIDTLL